MLSTSKLFRNPSAGATDPYFKYVPLLLETTTTNGQQNNTFLDSSTNNFTITRNGTPTQGSVTPYWPNGQWSNNLNGSSDYLTVPANTALALSSGDFTVELWFFKTSTSDGAVNDYASAGGFGFVIQNNNVQTFSTVGAQINFAGTININQWNHLALVRNSGTLTCYLNGASIGTPTADAKTYTSPSTLFIGKNAGASAQYFPGYLSNLRIVKGTAVYTGAFTPPTTPLTAITNTSLLTCQSNRFRDNSTNNFTLTPVSTPTVQAFQPFSPAASYTPAAYGGSGYFGVANTDYLSPASSAALAFGNNAYTVEFWLYMSAYTGGDNRTLDLGQANGSFAVSVSNTGAVALAKYGAVNVITSSNAFVLGQWNHIAISRTSTGTNGTAIYVNGTNVATGTDANNWTVVTSPRINGLAAFSLGWVGYLSNLRIVNGTAVYTGNFTPPTAPVTAITNTSLLLNFTNAGIYDAAVQNNAITVGDAQASTTVSKWSPTSMKFDGTGDYLDLGSNPAFVMGAGDWTVEGWVYPTATTAGHWMYLQGNASAFAAIRIGCQSNQVFLLISTNGTTFTVSSGLVGSVPNNAWTYLAVTRSGATVTLYVNGTSVYTSTALSTSALMTGTYNLVGRIDPTNLQYFTGYLQDVRITKGVARTITTPTAAFPTR